MNEVTIKLWGQECTLKPAPGRLGLVCKLGGHWELHLHGREPNVSLSLVYIDGDVEDGGEFSTDICVTAQEAADVIERIFRPLGRYIAHEVQAAIPEGLAFMCADIEHQIQCHADTVPRLLRECAKVVVDTDRFFCLTEDELVAMGL